MKKAVQVSSALSSAPIVLYAARKVHGSEPIRGGQATGFLWLHENVYYLITNWHNVTAWDPINDRALSNKAFTPDCLIIRLLVQVKDEGDIHILKPRHLIVDLYASDGKPIWLEHPRFGRKVDVVAIKIGEAGEWIIVSQPINACEELMDFQVVAGDDCFVLGYPLGLHGGVMFPIWKRASIASEPEIDLDDLPKILIDTATRQGMSGSPAIAVRRGTINPRGVSGFGAQTVIGMAETFLGVYSGRIADDPLGAQLGIVWKASVIEEIIAAGVTGRTPFESETCC